MSQQPLRVLLVDDETSIGEPLSKHLRQTHGYEVDTAANGQEALNRLEQTGGRYDVALIDDLLEPAPKQEPEPLGVTLTREIKSHYPNIEIIVFTGWGMESALETLRAGAYRYLAKPLNFDELDILIQMAAEHGRLRGIAYEKQVLEQLMETSPTLLSGRSLPDVLDTILHGVQAIGFDRVGLYLLSDDRQMMIGQAQVGINPAFVGHERPVAADSEIQILLSDSRPHVFERENIQPLPYEQVLGREGIYQWACAPLILHGEVIGKLTMDNKFSQQPILESELGPVALFASQAAAAIEQTRLYKEIAQERDHSAWLASQLLALHKITKEIQSELDLPRLLNLISRLAAELLGADAGGILLLDNEKKHLTFKGSFRLSQEIVEGTRDMIGGSISGRVAETGEPIIANDIPNEPRFYNPAADGEGLLAVISTPLWIGGEIIGTLDVHSKTDRFAFDEDDLQILSLMATQAAVAIQNAGLFEQTSRRAQALEALHQTALEITSYQQDSNLLGSILERAANLLRVKGGRLYLLDESGQQVRLAAASGDLEHLLGSKREMDDSDIGQAIKTKAPVFVSDYRNWPYRVRQYDKYDFKEVIAAPIIWRDRTWGAISINDKIEGRTFDEEDEKLLWHFGNLAAVALENAELIGSEADKLLRLEQLTQANSQIMGNLAIMPLDERLNLIAKHATEILHAEACGVLIVKRQGFLSLEASYGHRKGAFKKGREFAIRSGPQVGLNGHIAYEGNLFNAHGSELTSHFAVKGGEPNHALSAQCYSLLGIPLMKRSVGKDKLLGLLRVDNKKDRNGQAGPTVAFTQEDEWILRLFADAAVVAIEGAELVTQLSEQKNHWARLFASSPNGIIALNDQGDVTGFSDQAQKILKYSPNEVLDKPVDYLYDNPQEPRRIGGLLHSTKDGKLANYETILRSKDGERIPIRLAATWLYDAQGDQIGSVGYFEDLRVIIETEKRLDLLLKASNTVAQAENLNDGLQRLAEMMVTYLDISFCRSFLLDENQQHLIAKAVYPAPAPTDQLDWDPIPETVITIAEWPEIAEVLAEGSSNVFRMDNPQHQAFLTAQSHRLGLKNDIQSLLLIPLKARDWVVGLLALAELRPWGQAPFSKQKQELAMAIADQTGLLVDRIYLYETTDRHRQLLEALDTASRNIRAEKETFKLLQEVVRLAARLVGCDAGGLYINRPHLKELELQVTYELPSVLVGSRLPHSEGLVGLVARTEQSRIIYAYSDWSDREDIFEAYDFKTVIGIPLKQAGEVEAVLFVADRTGTSEVTSIDLEILERFAVQASIALQTSHLLSREQRKFRPLAILHKVSDYIQATRDLDKIIHVVLTGITAGYGLGFNRAAIFLLDEQRENLIGRMGIGHLTEAAAREDWLKHNRQEQEDFKEYLELVEQNALLVTPIGERINGLQVPLSTKDEDADIFSQVVLNGQHTLVTQEFLDDLQHDFVDAFEPDVPLIVIPLLARDQTIGLLVADNKFTQSPITSGDIESLLTFANTAAVAIDNIKLFRETEVARERLAKLLEQVSKARNAARVVAEVTVLENLRNTLTSIVQATQNVLNCDATVLYTYDQESGKLGYPPIMTGVYFPERTMSLPQAPTDSFIFTLLERSEPYIAENVLLDPILGKRRFPLDEKIESCIVLSVRVGDHKVGLIFIHYRQPHHFTDDEVINIELFAYQAAVAIRNAQQYEALKELDRKKTEFLSTVSHELRTPLTPVLSCIENMLSPDEMYGPLTDEQRTRLEIALTSVGEETRLIDNLLDLARIQEDKVAPEYEHGSIVEIVHNVTTVFKYDADHKKIALIEKFPDRDPLDVLIDVGKIKQVVTNLVGNALKFTAEGGTIVITTSRLDQMIEVKVTDTGIGIPKEEFKKIFDRFYQVDSSLTRKVGGTGIGLNISKKYIELHEGHIWVKSEVGKGSTFSFTLPLHSDEKD
jgi:PAS domain S-box-containing protein